MLFSFLLQQQPTNSIALFAPYILIALVFYFLLFMPMQKQKKKQAEMLKNLKSGDVVTTSGGIAVNSASPFFLHRGDTGTAFSILGLSLIHI